MTSLIVWQALLNMMVVMNAVPFTGIPLPFVSFGGSSLVVSLAAIGLLLSVSRATPRPEPAEPRPIPAGRVERPSLRPRAPAPRGCPPRPPLARRPITRARQPAKARGRAMPIAAS